MNLLLWHGVFDLTVFIFQQYLLSFGGDEPISHTDVNSQSDLLSIKHTQKWFEKFLWMFHLSGLHGGVFDTRFGRIITLYYIEITHTKKNHTNRKSKVLL